MPCKKKILLPANSPHSRGMRCTQDIAGGRSDQEDYEKGSLLRLPHEFLKGTVRTDSRASAFRHLPVIFIPQKRRVKGPQRAWLWFDRVDLTLAVGVIKKAKPIWFAGDIDFPVPPETACFDESISGQTQESRDFFELMILDADPAFAVAASSTLLAFEREHKKCLK
jgi:hypothetical protein